MQGPRRSLTARVGWLALCTIVVACGPRPSFSPFETYAAGESAIYGYVTDLYSCGLESATVTLTGTSDNSVTNTSGQYRLRVRSGESYTIKAERARFGIHSVSLDVGSEPLRHDFSLAPLPCPDGQCQAYRPPCRTEFLAR